MILTITIEVKEKHVNAYGGVDPLLDRMKEEFSKLRENSECGLIPISYECSTYPGWWGRFLQCPRRQKLKNQVDLSVR